MCLRFSSEILRAPRRSALYKPYEVVVAQSAFVRISSRRESDVFSAMRIVRSARRVFSPRSGHRVPVLSREATDRAANDEELRARLDHELNIINRMGFETYFLIVWDLCEWAARSDEW